MEEKVVFNLGGMTCALCSAKIEKRLIKQNGVNKVFANFSTDIVTVTFDNTLCNVDILKNTITKLGFYIDEGDGSSSKRYLKNLKTKVILSTLFTIPLIIAVLVCSADLCCVYLDPNYTSGISKFIATLRFKIYFLHNWKVQIILAAIVQFIIGFDFYKNALLSIKMRTWGMDILIAIGTLSTFSYSLYNIIEYGDALSNKLYFESGPMIITFVLIGRYIETLAKKKTSKSISELSKLKETKGNVLTENGVINKDIEKIDIGEVLIVRPGERIPLDGKIIEGDTQVDESMITGESLWKEKNPGDKVIAGTLNTSGSLKIKVLKTGNQTILAQIIDMVQNAQESKPEIQKLADKFSSIFIPFVLSVAIITFLVWFYLIYNGSKFFIEKPILYAVSVLVVSCPCALGLATPTAITIAQGVGAKKGILIKNGNSLELLNKIDTVVFDKTGTLTKGEHKVCRVESFNREYSDEEIIILSGSVELNSQHPIGKAIYKEMENRGLKPVVARDFEAVSGKGVKAVYNSKDIVIGTFDFINENEAKIEQSYRTNEIEVFISYDNFLIGKITLEDQIKEDSKETVEGLKGLGLDVIMITGDKEETAIKVSNQVGIDKFYSGVLPNNKAELVKKIKSENHKVLMVGDGINDAPALAYADVSIAIGSGTDVAIESSDIVILGENIKKIKTAINLSKKTFKKVKGNLIFSAGYNIILIPVAAFGLLNPEIACIFMALSSISVVLNSLSLKRFSKQKEA